MTTAQLSDLSMPLESEVRRSPEQSEWQPIARSGKFVRRASSRYWIVKKSTVLCFLPSWSTLLFERGLGEEGRFDVAARSTPKTSCQNYKQQLLRPRGGPSKAAHTVPGTWTTGVKEQQISKKGIKLIQKLLEIEKVIVREVVGDKHNLRKSANCKAQISTMCGVNDTDLCIAICRFSQVVFVTSNNFTHNLLFYFQ